jgi:hypothetical protein
VQGGSLQVLVGPGMIGHMPGLSSAVQRVTEIRLLVGFAGLGHLRYDSLE